MNNFFHTWQTIQEGTLRQRQIISNVGWASGGLILSIFHPVNTSYYQDRLYAVQMIHDKTLKRLKQLHNEKPTLKVQKNIKLMKLLNVYSAKAYTAHQYYISHVKDLKPDQKRKLRKEYKQLLSKMENEYNRKRSLIKRNYQKSI